MNNKTFRPSFKSIFPKPYLLPILFLLTLAAYLGNDLLKINLFLSIDFLFGSVAVWLIIWLFGLPIGGVVGFLVSLKTWVAWGHPYAVIIFTLETVIVGYFWQRNKQNLLTLTGLYWLLIGMPLVWLFYRIVMGLGTISALMILFKQPLNGIFNALVAIFIINAIEALDKKKIVSSGRYDLSFQNVLFNLLFAFVVVPALLLITWTADNTYQSMQENVQDRIDTQKVVISNLIFDWYETKSEILGVVLNNAENGASSDLTSPYYADFKAIEVVNNGEGALNCATLPNIRFNPDTLELFIKVAHQGSAANSCVVGIVDQETLGEQLNSVLASDVIQFILRKPTGEVIASYPEDETLVALDEGEIISLESGLSQWLTKQQLPIMARNAQSFYFKRMQIREDIPWTLFTFVPARSYIDGLQYQYLVSLGVLLGIFAIALLMSALVSRTLVKPLSHLATETSNLPDKLASNQGFSLPQSPVVEIASLGTNFQDMADKLAQQFQDLRQVNQQLGEQKEELSITLTNLQNTQAQLVQSEKMAALGQLVAGIAHEINTPLGAIRSSIENIDDFLKTHLLDIPQFFQNLSPDHQKQFLQLLEQTTQQPLAITSKEKRQIRRKLMAQLDEHNIPNSDSISDTLVDIGIYENIDPFIEMLKDPQQDHLLQMSYQFSSLQRSTQTIVTATERAAKIVFALKTYARHDYKGELLKANIIDGLDTVLTLYHNQLKHGVEVVQKYEQVPEILCYPDELNQVWTNLIHNALQAMGYKGILTLEVGVRDRHIQVNITDNGQGIPPEIQEKIFQPFFTTKSSGEGSGLGLDIVKKIIDKHQGMIKVTSVPGNTTFQVMIPLEPGE
ncbi:GHKL domain-containing protein [Spirulina subsalsa FACHB-351]|uniref:histidine kinase n=1 Tax=Spirulina subsalsa FACHB-351 TaxID=234711 RepID=A0ABT3L5D6_9CYAN|nr:ATP-binding protein [Spirulina subsalsa]MCW6036205.1 GHKL domain-containing protein [Spirulina subsalsa FACHB-351]